MSGNTKMRPARLVALEQMCTWADAGERESAGRNRSPLIDRINQAAGVPLGSPYCAAAAKYAFAQAGIPDFGGPHAASVGYVEQWAKDHGWLQARPRRGDGFCWRLDGDTWPDHFGMILRVRSWGGLLFTVDTVEANTSSSNAGSQDDGGGFYYRTRTFRRGQVSFVRDPRSASRDPFAHLEQANRRRLSALRVWIGARHRAGWSWPRIKRSTNWREYLRRGGR